MKSESSAAYALPTSNRLSFAAFALTLLLVPFAQRTLQAQAYSGYGATPQDQQQPYAQQSDGDGQQQYSQPQQLAQQPYDDPNGQYAPQQQYAQQPQQGGQPFAADQLEQLVAPIALYPDNLVAQILAAATYPAQVVAADNWLHAQGYVSPDQIAYGADAQTNWDPSVKALTAFPQVLDLMNHDLRWTTDLGNAYYNQPQDVMQTIQVMRQRAQSAGTLESTPQENVSDNQGYIQVAPVNPQVVYVPMYNPWGVYGQPVAPYPGFSLFGALQSLAGSGVVRYGLGIAMGAFSHTPFGWAGWALNWLASNILFHQSPYYSRSTSVAHRGGGGYYGSRGGGINRTPNGYGRPEQGMNRFGNGLGQGNGYARGNGTVAPARPPVRPAENYGYNRSENRAGEAPGRGYAGNYVRPATPNYAYNRPQSQLPVPAREQAYQGAGGYGNRFGASTPQQGYPARPVAPYAGQQAYRAPSQAYQRNDYAQHAYAGGGSYGSGPRSFAEPKQERSGGSHMFGGGNHGEEHSHSSYKVPKAPKMSGGGGGHHGGGGVFHHAR
jgi:Protein of unknown function (DUF3300)